MFSDIFPLPLQQANQFGITGTPLFPSAGVTEKQDEETEEGEGEMGEEGREGGGGEEEGEGEGEEEGGGEEGGEEDRGGEEGEGEEERGGEREKEVGEVEIKSKPNVEKPEERPGPSGQSEE